MNRKTFWRCLILVFTLIFAVTSLAAANGQDEKSLDEKVVEALRRDWWLKFYEGEIMHDKNIYNILLLGSDRKAWDTDVGRADTTMLCSLNMKTGEIKLISFERGIFVPIPGYPDGVLLTYAYTLGGPELSVSLIKNLFHIEVDGYAHVDFESFPTIVDLLGGVDIELTGIEASALNGESYSNAWTENKVYEGWNHLNGNDALAYCRLRFTDDDWFRQERQRKVLDACKKQVKELGAIELANHISKIVPLVDTDIGAGDIAKLSVHALKFAHGGLSTMQVPDVNIANHVIQCFSDYESQKISNFLYGTDYELESPYYKYYDEE